MQDIVIIAISCFFFVLISIISVSSIISTASIGALSRSGGDLSPRKQSPFTLSSVTFSLVRGHPFPLHLSSPPVLPYPYNIYSGYIGYIGYPL